MYEYFALNCELSVQAEWTLESRNGGKVKFWGSLTYTYHDGPIINARYTGDIKKLHDDNHFAIVYSESNSLRGCTILNAHVRNVRHIAGNDDCDITIVGTHILTNYVEGFDERKIFDTANLYYDGIDIFWDKDIVDTTTRRKDFGVLVTHGEKIFFKTKFNNCDIRLLQGAAVSSSHPGGAEIRLVTRMEITSATPLTFNEIYGTAYEANKCINFILGNSNNFRKMTIRQLLETEDPIERGAKTSSVIFNKFKLDTEKRFMPVVQFRENSEASEIICKIFNIYNKYRTSIISALSAIEIDNDISYKFFSMCRALESAFSQEKKLKNPDIKEFIKEATELLPPCIDRYEIIISQLRSIGGRTLAEQLNEIDAFIFEMCGVPVGFSKREEYAIQGLSKDIVKARNSAAHYNGNINKIRGLEFYEHYWVLKRCFYAYIFLKAGVSGNFVKNNILRFKFLAE